MLDMSLRLHENVHSLLVLLLLLLFVFFGARRFGSGERRLHLLFVLATFAKRYLTLCTTATHYYVQHYARIWFSHGPSGLWRWRV